jgi:ubiquinone/menaquinone biosynthesis C-methylase UbiE
MPTAASPPSFKRRVQAFWDTTPCGSKHADAPEGSRKFFQQVEQRRYELEPFIPEYAEFERSQGETVLEVGVGLGTDLARFARAGADVTGIDFSEHSVELARRRLALEGLAGEVHVADAELLPFPDDAFDRVYSWGVLHHTPGTERAAQELVRVLKPGGRLCVMLYARRSWVAFALWARHALLTGKPRRSLADVVAHHMESVGTKAFTRTEVRRMFRDLSEVQVEHVGTPYDRRVVGPLAALTGRHLGWFIVVRGAL